MIAAVSLATNKPSLENFSASLTGDQYLLSGAGEEVGADCIVSLLVELVHMRIYKETVVGVQELASCFIRRGFSFIFPCVHFLHHSLLESSVNLPPTKLSL